VIFWDNTNIDILKPSNPEAQRNTFSSYYSGNVAKAAVFVQPSGWMGSHDLWMGAVSDSDYFGRSGILQEQIEYVAKYDKANEDHKWNNVLDKGYRVGGAAWRVGNQFVLQPAFARSNKKFTTFETIRNSAIASDRGGNERAVRLAKMSGYLENAAKPNVSFDTIAIVWLCRSFQCNFMYHPVYR
jgi:DDE superfamily endonuclease